MTLPTSQRAYVVIEKGKADVKSDNVLPKLEPDSVIIKVKAVSFNPTDWKHIKFGLKEGASVGSDFAGDIVEIGESAKASGFKVGDAVAGYLRGGVHDANNGAFQEYVRALPESIWRKPSNLSYEAAAPMGGIALSTAAQALYHKLRLPYPGQQTSGNPATILIWAGSTGVGLYTIRLAKLSGLSVVTTASPKNHELLKKIGADAVFDYKDPEAPAKIKEWSKGSIEYGLDTISEHGSTKLAVAAFGDKGGKLMTLLTTEREDTWPANVIVEYMLVYGALTKGEQDFYDMATWNKILTKLVEEGKLGEDSVPLKRWDGGFNGIRSALQYVEDGKVSAEKLVLSLE